MMHPLMTFLIVSIFTLCFTHAEHITCLAKVSAQPARLASSSTGALDDFDKPVASHAVAPTDPTVQLSSDASSEMPPAPAMPEG